MRLFNLLSSRRGRLTAFFALYITEGIPLGFASTAVATQLRRMGAGPAEIGGFIALSFLPWAFKWAFGPVIDVFRSKRFGHRRAWILFTQAMMVLTLLALIPISLPSGLGMFTAILFVHNIFGAMQDVAIDAMAVNSLAENERGLANGLMFAGAAVGQIIGGSGVLFLLPYMGFQGSFVFVAAAIMLVTIVVVLPMKEAVMARMEASAATAAIGLNAAMIELREFASRSFQSFLGSRPAFAGVFFALLPAGAMALGIALGSNLAVEFGMDDDEVANLNLVSMLFGGIAVVLGGVWSDRLGRRRTLAIYIALMTPPVLYLAWHLQRAGYTFPRQPGSPRQEALIWHLWAASITYSFAQGLSYGSRAAIMMDITNPRVAGTQFTAYMALGNLAIAFASTWQGVAVEAFGYPKTLLVDGIAGLLCIFLLPAMGKATAVAADHLCDTRAEGRARNMARALALLCLSFVPYLWLHDPKSSIVDIADTLFALVFIASALSLYASTLLQRTSALLRRTCKCLAVALLALYARRWLPVGEANLALCSIVVIAAGLALAKISGNAWIGLTTGDDSQAASERRQGYPELLTP